MGRLEGDTWKCTTQISFESVAWRRMFHYFLSKFGFDTISTLFWLTTRPGPVAADRVKTWATWDRRTSRPPSVWRHPGKVKARLRPPVRFGFMDDPDKASRTTDNKALSKQSPNNALFKQARNKLVLGQSAGPSFRHHLCPLNKGVLFTSTLAPPSSISFLSRVYVSLRRCSTTYTLLIPSSPTNPKNTTAS